MNNIFELKDIVWFLLGWLVPELIKALIHTLTEKRIMNAIKKENTHYIANGENICPLAHGSPFFNKSDLVFEEPIESLHFSMPESIHSNICEHNPDFEHTNWGEAQLYWNTEDDSKLPSSIIHLSPNASVEDIQQIIIDEKKEIANMFLNRASQALFNGEKYGIKEVKDRRVGNEEKAKIVFSCIKTDYYTHKVMAAVYQKLIEMGKMQPTNGLENINEYYPFLTCIGINVLLVIERKKRVVLTKRSKKLINMQEDQWHLSMNEGLSITDLSLGAIDLEGCIKRGLREELGLDINEFDQIAIHYSDVFCTKNPLEVGILIIVAIDDLAESKVRESYNVAQDAPFESTGDDETGLAFLQISRSEIESFCKNNKVTDAAKYGLKMLCIRKARL